MRTAFYFTLACTARCAHCITFAGPRISRKMSLDEALRAIGMIRETADLDGVVFTGGENFIHKNELLELVRECTRLGLKSEVISNGYWGTSVKAAVEMLRPFRDARLETIRLSVDDYHLPYVPPARIHTALKAMREVGFTPLITGVVPHRNMVHAASKVRETLSVVDFDFDCWDEPSAERLAERVRSKWVPDLLALLERYEFSLSDLFMADDIVTLRCEELGPGAQRLADYFAESKILVQYQSLATEGRGRGLLDQVELKHVDETPDVVCDSVGWSPTINPEGNVSPCCSSWVNVPGLRIGNIADTSMAELMERIKEDPVVLFMHYQGPRVLIKYLRDKGHQLPEGYSHPCHLCGTALERYSRQELERHIEDFYQENPWRMLFTSRGFRPDVDPTMPFLPLAEAGVRRAAPRVLSQSEGRRFFGILEWRGHRRGARLECSVDELVETLRAEGHSVTLEPIENGAPADCHVAALRTLGCRWLEVIQRLEAPPFDEAGVRALSERLNTRAVAFDYRYEEGVFHHRLYASGRIVESLDATADSQGVSLAFGSERAEAPVDDDVRGDPARYVGDFFVALRLREWGISVETLESGDVPFPPTLIVESYFLQVS